MFHIFFGLLRRRMLWLLPLTLDKVNMRASVRRIWCPRPPGTKMVKVVIWN